MIRPTAVRAIARSAPLSSGAFRASPRSFAPAKQPVFEPHVARITFATVKSWIPTLALWGGAGGGAVMLFMSSVPVFQHDILHKIPIVKGFFVDETPDSDKPF